MMKRRKLKPSLRDEEGWAVTKWLRNLRVPEAGRNHSRQNIGDLLSFGPYDSSFAICHWPSDS